MDNEESLISKLTNETYTEVLVKDQPSTCVDLHKYFEKRLNQVDLISLGNYLDQHFLSHRSLVLESFSGCYRLNYKELILDFPSNWSIFNEIKNTDLVYLNQSLDHEFLLDIFSEINGTFQNIILVKENQRILLVFLPEEESLDHVKWLRSYFEKKNKVNEEKIAA